MDAALQALLHRGGGEADACDRARAALAHFARMTAGAAPPSFERTPLLGGAPVAAARSRRNGPPAEAHANGAAGLDAHKDKTAHRRTYELETTRA